MKKRYVYIIQRGQLGIREHNRFEMGIDSVYSSKADAELAVKQELEINGATDIDKTAYEFSNAMNWQTDYTYTTKDGRKVTLRTIICKMELKSF